MNGLERGRPGLPLRACGKILSGFSFWLLYPGFFFYHFLVGAGILPRFIGGWFGPVSLLAFVGFVPLLMLAVGHVRGRSLQLLLLFVLLNVSVMLWVGAHAVLGAGHQQRPAVVSQAAATLVFWVTMFMIGLYWGHRSFWSRWIVWGSLGMMVILTLYNIDAQSLVFALGLDASSSEGEVVTYQGFARSLAVTLLAGLAVSRRPIAVSTLVFGGVVALFFLGARAELYGFLMVTPILFWMGYRSRPWSATLIATVGTIALAFLAFHFWETISGSRQLQFILDLETSRSLQVRQELLRQGWEGVTSDPLIGEFAGHVLRGGSTGAYVHNAISAWRQFGPVTFLLYVGLTVTTSAISVRRTVFARVDLTTWRLALLVNVFSLILLTTAKSVYWPVVALGWGLTAGALEGDAAPNRDDGW